MRETSLATMILQRAERYGAKPAMRTKRRGQWEDISWQTLGEKIVRAAQGLFALGFRPGDRLASSSIIAFVLDVQQFHRRLLA